MAYPPSLRQDHTLRTFFGGALREAVCRTAGTWLREIRNYVGGGGVGPGKPQADPRERTCWPRVKVASTCVLLTKARPSASGPLGLLDDRQRLS